MAVAQGCSFALNALLTFDATSVAWRSSSVLNGGERIVCSLFIVFRFVDYLVCAALNTSMKAVSLRAPN